ncbi:MAG: FAD-binding oxidoreductase [Robiginitomaculum sp.]|nr:FAD-binding oxidoreductase [Robiginitomaculum sp.]
MINSDTTIRDIKAKIPDNIWSQDPDIIAPYLSEWRGRWHGKTPMILRPRTAQDIADIVKICAQYKTPITVQGGNTGLVGGQIPEGEILLSTQYLNQIRSTSVNNMSMVCEAGVTLENAQIAADDIGLKFPLSLASQDACTIGGNLSTNAGGVHVLKYGTAKELVFGVEAVLANGEIFHGLTDLRKDNTGYNLSNILLGAEGTLGIITAASLKLFPKPTETIRVMAAIKTPQHALELLSCVRIGNHLSMFEIMPALGLEYITTHIPNMRDPFTENHPWYVIFDWEFSDQKDPQNFAESALGNAMEKGLILDAVIAANESQSNALLALRENLSAAQKPIGATIKHDITVPVSDVATFIQKANAAVLKHTPDCHPLPFGHLGDGNIHYNIGQPENLTGEQFMALEPDINDIVYDIVDALCGSISAEHGIGILKKNQLAKRADPAKLGMMKRIKTSLDPDGILNPRNIL